MIKTYLGLDPGLTIGYAIVGVDTETGDLVELTVGQQKTADWKCFATKPWNLIPDVDAVIIEDFVGSGYRSVQSNHVLKQIGAFESFGKYLNKEVVVQAPKMRRKFLAWAKMIYKQETGFKVCRHGHDALAHAFKTIAGEIVHPRTWEKEL